jgi:hypothetical protein
VLQWLNDDFFLTVGQHTPPLLLGTQEEQREQARERAAVPVRVLARYGFPRARLEQLRDLITQQLDKQAESQATQREIE